MYIRDVSRTFRPQGEEGMYSTVLELHVQVHALSSLQGGVFISGVTAHPCTMYVASMTSGTDGRSGIMYLKCAKGRASEMPKS